MCRLWCIETGGNRRDFWASTLREIAFDLDVSSAKQFRDEQSRRWHTWHAAALPNTKNFPKFSEFVPSAETKAAPQTVAVKQSTEAQIAAVKQIFDRRKKGG